MFNPSDYLKILKYLNLSINYKTEILQKLSEIEGDAILENEVKQTLNNLDAIQTTITNERNNPNSALIRADVLEWEPGGKRTEGMLEERLTLLYHLANLLGLEWRQTIASRTISIEARFI